MQWPKLLLFFNNLGYPAPSKMSTYQDWLYQCFVYETSHRQTNHISIAYEWWLGFPEWYVDTVLCGAMCMHYTIENCKVCWEWTKFMSVRPKSSRNSTIRLGKIYFNFQNNLWGKVLAETAVGGNFSKIDTLWRHEVTIKSELEDENHRTPWTHLL